MTIRILPLLLAAVLTLPNASWAKTSEPSNLADLRAEFLATDNLDETIKRLNQLELQVLALIEDEPLKLGSLGSAILDIYPASQTGHLALQRYYQHLEASEAEADHLSELERIQAAMLDSGDGTAESPFVIMTVADAHAFTVHSELAPVGSIYQSSEHASFGLLLVARPANAKLRQVFFDLSHLLAAYNSGEAGDPHAENPWALIRTLAAEMDGAAQTAIGAYLANVKKYEDALSWLKVASRSGNVLANTLLARIYWTQSEGEEDEEKIKELQQLTEENYLHAISQGSTDAMYTLANLYFSDSLGADNVTSGMALLEQAAELGHAESLIYLAHIYNTGQIAGAEVVDKDKARDYFQRAAALNHHGAVLSYARFLVAEQAPVDVEDSIFGSLEELAEDDDAEAMIVLANLHARGIAPRASTRTAVRWYKRAVKLNPENPDIVNEVVWTLTVTDVKGMKRTRYARRTMDKLMNSVASANQRPEYLDTWAATYAAAGNFERAIELQLSAIDVAKKTQREDVLEILYTHLEQFQAGNAITEPAP